jgi:PPOX class probable F420-dependent enzyme
LVGIGQRPAHRVSTALRSQQATPRLPREDMTPMLDLTTEAGQRADRQLQQEHVVWLTTVNADGQPQSSPVWFFWENGTFLHHSKPDQKIRNLRRHPRVALHLNEGPNGEVVTIEGTAEVLAGDTAAHVRPAYLEKYRDGIQQLGLTPEQLIADYPVTFRVTPTRMRVW